MSQIIYALLAMALVLILSLNLQRGISRTSQGQTVNEVGTQLTGVGTEILELIGRSHFDWYNWENGDNTPDRPYCGRVADDQLAFLSEPDASNPTSTMGDCSDIGSCPYIEGFSGLDTTLTRSEFDYVVTVDTVHYVDPTDFTTISATQTFAKRVQVTVENPHLYVGDDTTNTFSLTLDRVFTYGCITDPNMIPFVRATETCPVQPACSILP